MLRPTLHNNCHAAPENSGAVFLHKRNDRPKPIVQTIMIQGTVAPLLGAGVEQCPYEALRWQTQRLCQAADVPYRGEHVFRHTFATNCYHKGIDVKILSKLLGHADVNITYNVYVHLYGDGFDEMYAAIVSEK